jgi:dihydroneopterin aldolase
MTLMLASVTGAEEADIAVRHGADIVDVKDVHAGFGPVDAALVRATAEAVGRRLRDWIEALAGCSGRAIIVPGGGPFADAVRSAQLQIGFDDRTAHHMALLAMVQYGRALAGTNGALLPADTVEAIHNTLSTGRIPVWMPARMVLDTADIAASWDVTSDSLAAWLGARIGGERLFLVKHADSLSRPASVENLAARGILDRAFPRHLRKSLLRAFILGPPTMPWRAPPSRPARRPVSPLSSVGAAAMR